MGPRNLSAQRMFEELAREHRPECAFRGRSARDFRNWKRRTLPRVLATLGGFPRRVPPRDEVVFIPTDRQEYQTQKVISR